MNSGVLVAIIATFFIVWLLALVKTEHISLHGVSECTRKTCAAAPEPLQCCNECHVAEWYSENDKKVRFLFESEAPACTYMDCEKQCFKRLWSYGFQFTHVPGLTDTFISLFTHWE